METGARKTHRGLLYTLLILLTAIVIALCGYLKQWDNTRLISNSVFLMLGCFLVLFLHAFSKEKDIYDYDNKEHFGRFVLLWFLFLGLAVACSFLPVSGWPFLVVYLSFSLFSNLPIGMVAGSVILLVTVLLSGEGILAFLLYFLCGIVCVCLFQKLDHNYKIGIPLTVSVLCLIVCLTAGVVLYKNEKLNLEMFLIPFINIFVSIVLMLIVLKFFSSTYIYRYHVKYLEINDQEFPLLAKWKEQDRAKYYQAVHTAYFCDRIATRLGLDVQATKAAGYYRHISSMYGEESWEECRRICEENSFPPAVHSILQELLDKQTPVRNKETAIVILSDSVISAILFLFQTQPQQKPDYDKVVDTVFKSKLESGVFANCNLTLEELSLTERIFKEEKIYYDFLR